VLAELIIAMLTIADHADVIIVMITTAVTIMINPLSSS